MMNILKEKDVLKITQMYVPGKDLSITNGRK